jgi:hypothetical protein
MRDKKWRVMQSLKFQNIRIKHSCNKVWSIDLKAENLYFGPSDQSYKLRKNKKVNYTRFNKKDLHKHPFKIRDMKKLLGD